MKRFLIIAFVLVAVLMIVVWQWDVRRQTAVSNTSLLPLLSEESTAGFARATEPNAITFPQDYGPHNEYQTEWWYYTGNLTADSGEEFGYQLTFFRRALTPDEQTVAATSDWRSNQVYLAHFTITDVNGQAFYPQERFSRGGAGLAGAQAAPYAVWLENWSAREIAPGVVHLFAESENVTLDLELTQTLDPILHGNGGLSPKGIEAGNASYYYSLVQQATTGTIRIGDKQVNVSGKSWKDHEYSTSALSQGAVGWDWISLQLDNGQSLMLFQIRNEDGSLEPFSSGSFIAADGTVTPLSLEDWQLEVTDSWTSPTNGAEYPAGWVIRVPSLDIELAGRPLLANQELNVSTTYWEGATAFSGTVAGQAVTAKGYIELTGYAESMNGRL